MKINCTLESTWMQTKLAEDLAEIVAAMNTRLCLRALYRAGLSDHSAEYNQHPYTDEFRDVRRLVSGISSPVERRAFVRLLKHYLNEKLSTQHRTARRYVESVRQHQKTQLDNNK